MSGAHTPGPWRAVDVSLKPTADDDGVRFFDIRAGDECRSNYSPALIGYYDCGGRDIAQVMKGHTYGAANACLIAAAPELLEALDEAYAELLADSARDGPRCLLLTTIEAALAKARGEA